MDKAGLLRSIAETGYNVGFGAKVNLATYDIAQKLPGLLGFISLAVGVFALIWEPLNSKIVAATLLVMGILGIYVSPYDKSQINYCTEGERLTSIFYRLRDLYRDVQATDDFDSLEFFRKALTEIQTDFLSFSQSNQMFLSDWYAHYKFFWQMQIDWIDEQLEFRFLRDKIPLSFTLFVIALMIGLGLVVSQNISC